VNHARSEAGGLLPIALCGFNGGRMVLRLAGFGLAYKARYWPFPHRIEARILMRRGGGAGSRRRVLPHGDQQHDTRMVRDDGDCGDRGSPTRRQGRGFRRA
jgi:hypothetical protein